MVKIIKIGVNNSKKTLPITDKAVVSYLNLVKLQQNISKSPKNDFFSDIKKGLEKVGNVIEKVGNEIEKQGEKLIKYQEKKIIKTVETVYKVQQTVKNTVQDVAMGVISNPDANFDAEKIMMNQFELKAAQSQYTKLKEEYKLVLGTQKAVPSYSYNLPELKRSIYTMQEEISREKMLLNLETILRKGGDGYDPKGRKPFILSDLEPININEKNKFEDEILRITKIFLSNSFKVDKSLSCFNEVSKEYFKESACALREIYEIKNELPIKLAERIPLLGIIPKTLRVNEQVRLTKCIIKDYKDVAEKYVKKGMTPYIDEYAKQYDTILNYVLKNLDTDSKEKLSEKCMDKIKEAQDLRYNVTSKLIKGFSFGGKKIIDACNNVKEKGTKEIVTKAIFAISGLI